MCADGETLLLPNLAEYIRLLVLEGHYIEVVSNMVLTKKLEPILALGNDILSHVEFKCSFHYLELEKRGLLNQFAENVNCAWEAGASINVEITPSDELVPKIDEIKDFSLEHFGALPHLTIARDDASEGIKRLTELPLDEYNAIWSSFDSSFWDFKTKIFGERRREFCYAGAWSYLVDMSSGEARQCYCGSPLGNVFANPDEPLPKKPIARCRIAHCYNGHMLAASGLLPDLDLGYRYGNIRDRGRVNGAHWLHPELKVFFNERVNESNEELRPAAKMCALAKGSAIAGAYLVGRRVKRLLRAAKQQHKK